MFTLTINTGNAAFHCPDDPTMDDYYLREELQDILCGVIQQLELGNSSGKTVDINGNVCGEWEIK